MTRNMRTVLWTILGALLVFAFFLGPLPARGATFYVSPIATTGDGSQSNPWSWADLSINTNQQKVHPGDDIALMDGLYTLTPLIWRVPGSATAGYITIHSMFPSGAILRGPPIGSLLGQTAWSGISIRANYVHLAGFTLERAPDSGINVAGQYADLDGLTLRWCAQSHPVGSSGGEGVLIATAGDFCHIHGCTISYSREHAVYAAGACKGAVIEGNDCSYSGVQADGTQWQTGGVALLQANGEGVVPRPEGCQNLTFRGNSLHDNVGFGILFLFASNSVIEANHIYGNTRPGIALSAGSCDNAVRLNSVDGGLQDAFAVTSSGNFGPAVRNTLTGNILQAAGKSTPIDVASQDSIKSGGGNTLLASGPAVAKVGTLLLTLQQFTAMFEAAQTGTGT